MNSMDYEIKSFAEDALHIAFVIDENGQERAITPEMIDSACHHLADAFRIPTMESGTFPA